MRIIWSVPLRVEVNHTATKADIRELVLNAIQSINESDTFNPDVSLDPNVSLDADPEFEGV
jgi:hypothetical protein